MFLGEDGFIWWVGVVEDISDPLLMGRAKVRVFGHHAKHFKTEEEDELPLNRHPISQLPWAVVIHPPNVPNFYGHLRLGDWVFGFFLDGAMKQEPAILGFLPTVPLHLPGYEKSYPASVTEEELNKFGKYGDNKRTFWHVYDKNNPFSLPGEFAEPGKEYTHRLYRYSFESPSGHKVELIDDVTDIHVQEAKFSHANGSKLRMTQDHLGNHDLNLTESGGQNVQMHTDKDGNKKLSITNPGGQEIKFYTTSGGDCTINISHPKGASISISADGTVTVSSSKGVSLSSPQSIGISAPAINLNTSTLNLGSASLICGPITAANVTSGLITATDVTLPSIGGLATKIPAMDAQIEIAKTLPPPDGIGQL